MIEKFLRNHPSLNYADDIKAICEPLKLLNISYFSHAIINQKQEMTAIATNPDFFHLYFSKGYYEFDLHKATMSCEENMIIWDLFEITSQTKEMDYDFNSFNLGHTFSIVLEQPKEKQCFHFAADLGRASMNGRYLQLVDELKKFINYFKDKIGKKGPLVESYQRKIQLNPNKGGYQSPEWDASSSSEEFNSKIKSNRMYSSEFAGYLTAREADCLFQLSLGKTFAEVALLLEISERTVKAHTHSAKEKLRSSNQFQLGMRYAKLLNSNNV